MDLTKLSNNNFLKTLEFKNTLYYHPSFLNKGGIHILNQNSLLCKKIHIDNFHSKDYEIVLNMLEDINCSRCKKLYRKIKREKIL